MRYSGSPSKGKRVFGMIVGLVVGLLVGYILTVKGVFDFGPNLGMMSIFEKSLPVFGVILSCLISIFLGFLGFKFPKPFVAVTFAIWVVFKGIGEVTKNNDNSGVKL